MGGFLLQLLRTVRLLRRVLAEPEGRVPAGLLMAERAGRRPRGH